VSWINRGIDMGTSTFKVVKVAPGYFLALLSVLRKNRKRVTRREPASAEHPAAVGRQ
jgi:hypothetical protein